MPHALAGTTPFPQPRPVAHSAERPTARRARVYTTGVFDILHRGHLNILTQAAALGDLTVGIMTDLGVEKAKGSRPILTLDERDAQIQSLPFVAQIIHYADTDQCPVYEAIKPDIVVQGDDWLHSADRSACLDYFRNQKVRLVLLPRTEGISTTEIRKRVERSVRRDERFLLEQLQMVEVAELRLFENYDEAKVARLQAKILHEGVFLNPIAIVRERIVIDGVNRLEAIRRLGAERAPCVLYDYASVDLLGNVHFSSNGKITRLSEFAREEGDRLAFPRRTPADILHAVETGVLIPNGETFHRLPQNIIRLPVPLSALCSKDDFDLGAFIRERIDAGQVRFLQSAVYVCDEW